MTTQKRTASEATTTPRARPARTARSERAAENKARHQEGGRHTTEARAAGWSTTQVAAPIAAFLTAGLLAGTGYVFKKGLGELLDRALAGAAHQGSNVARATAALPSTIAADLREQGHASLSRILEVAGLERRSSLRYFGGPAVGVVCGFAAGALVTHFFGAKILASLREGAAARVAGSAPSTTSATSSANGVDGAGAYPPVVAHIPR